MYLYTRTPAALYYSSCYAYTWDYIRRTCRMPTICNCCCISYMCNMTDINYRGIYSLCKNVKGIKLHACVVEELMTYPVILSILCLLTQPLIHAIYILPLSVPRFFLYSLVVTFMHNVIHTRITIIIVTT